MTERKKDQVPKLCVQLLNKSILRDDNERFLHAENFETQISNVTLKLSKLLRLIPDAMDVKSKQIDEATSRNNTGKDEKSTKANVVNVNFDGLEIGDDKMTAVDKK